MRLTLRACSQLPKYKIDRYAIGDSITIETPEGTTPLITPDGTSVIVVQDVTPLSNPLAPIKKATKK